MPNQPYLPASGVSGVNEAIAGHSSLRFGSCPWLTVEITICRAVAQLCSNLFWTPGPLPLWVPPCPSWSVQLVLKLRLRLGLQEVVGAGGLWVTPLGRGRGHPEAGSPGYHPHPSLPGPA